MVIVHTRGLVLGIMKEQKCFWKKKIVHEGWGIEK
jgi:hypothetical protein